MPMMAGGIEMTFCVSDGGRERYNNGKTIKLPSHLFSAEDFEVKATHNIIHYSEEEQETQRGPRRQNK